MPSDNEYIIHVVNDDGDNSGPVTPASAGATQDNAGDGLSGKPNWSKSADAAKSAAKKIVSTATVASVADTLISYQINTVSLRTGAREYEQRLQFGYSTFKQISTSIIGGAMVGGPVGAAAGLFLGVGLQAINWVQNGATIQLNRQLENISLGMASERAGYNNSRSEKQ